MERRATRKRHFAEVEIRNVLGGRRGADGDWNRNATIEVPTEAGLNDAVHAGFPAAFNGLFAANEVFAARFLIPERKAVKAFHYAHHLRSRLPPGWRRRRDGVFIPITGQPSGSQFDAR